MLVNEKVAIEHGLKADEYKKKHIEQQKDHPFFEPDTSSHGGEHNGQTSATKRNARLQKKAEG